MLQASVLLKPCNPLQCSCLENPRDGGAWWAAIYGAAQGWTRLKRLSSSRSSSKPPTLKICSNIACSNLQQHFLCILHELQGIHFSFLIYYFPYTIPAVLVCVGGAPVQTRRPANGICLSVVSKNRKP